MVIGNNITSENLITVKKLINNWQIASTLKKKKKKWKIRVNSTRLATWLNPRPVWPATWLTRLKMTCFDPWPVLTRDSIDPSCPTPSVLPCLLPFMDKTCLLCLWLYYEFNEKLKEQSNNLIWLNYYAGEMRRLTNQKGRWGIWVT